MDAKKVGAFVVFVILLCISAAVGLEDGKTMEELLLGQLVDPVSGEVDQDMAELLCTSCRLDLIHMEAVEDIDTCIPEAESGNTDEINAQSQSFRKENIQKMINILRPQLKQSLLDCLRKNNHMVHVSGEEGSSNIWYMKYLGSLFPRSNAPRRSLGGELLQIITESRVPAPALLPAPPVGSPLSSPAPSSSQVPDPQPTASSPLPHFFPPPDLDSQPPPVENSSVSPESGSNGQADKKKSNHKPVVIAVVVTTVVTFFVAALLFLCYNKVCRTGSGSRQNDDRPLLSLSLSEYSGGSAHNSYAIGNSIKGEKVGPPTFSHNSNHNTKASPWDSNFYFNSDVHKTSLDEPPLPGATGGAAKFSSGSFGTSVNINARVSPPLRPPPGRVGITPPGQNPLKPPPGKADPLPPEPPSSFRPSSGKAGPPPPPPPLVPPPSLKLHDAIAPPPGPPPPPAPPSIIAGPRPPPPPKAPPPGPPPPLAPPSIRAGPSPPPPPKSGAPPPRPPPSIATNSKVPRPPPLGSKLSSDTPGEKVGLEGNADAPKAKLKPFFWDKVLANPDTSMVWHQIKSGSFQFNEEMIETLFGYNAADKNKYERKKEASSQEPSTQYIRIIDSKKAQNLSILLRALSVTIEEVSDALHEGNELPSELLQTLLKMAPTTEEELKLRLFNGEVSQLGPAERFLKALVNIPFAFKRLEALLFMGTIQEEVTTTKESFATVEVACKELRNSRLFLKLLEAVLKTGNRMNDGTFRGGAQAFKLDTLLKLSDVKGKDGKTTLLHFVVQEIIRSEGLRAARLAKENQSLSSIKSDNLLEDTPHDSEEHYFSLGLQVVSGLGNELENVKKAAVLDSDSLTGSVAKLSHALVKTRGFLNSDMKNLGEESQFHQTLKMFVQHAEIDVKWLQEEEKKIIALVKSTGDYFHGNAGKDEGLRLFVIVRDLLIMLDKVCREVRDAPKRPTKSHKKEANTAPSSSEPHQLPPDIRQKLFPAIKDRRMDNSSSDDEDP